MLDTESTFARIDHRQVLKACFGDREQSQRALDACASFNGPEIDIAVRRLLPILYRRWGLTAGNRLIELAHRVYLTTWQQNRERMAVIGSLLRDFEKTGIESMLLKGAALTLRHYRDYGLRNMGDFDLLVHRNDIEPAIRVLFQNGWIAEEGCTIDAIRRQSRVRHAWQFQRGDTQNCDLHWQPLARCYSPQVAEMFWQGAETVKLDDLAVKLPCPTDQFFQVCVHAMHWEWTPNLYWVADALAVLRDSEIDWDRAAVLAAASDMRMRFTQARATLVSQFPHAIPEWTEQAGVPAWERHEYRLMQKRCPLGFLDSLAWHAYHFRRIRHFDVQWRDVPACMGFTQYLTTFLDAPTWRILLTKLCAQAKLRAQTYISPAS